DDQSSQAKDVIHMTSRSPKFASEDLEYAMDLIFAGGNQGTCSKRGSFQQWVESPGICQLLEQWLTITPVPNLYKSNLRCKIKRKQIQKIIFVETRKKNLRADQSV
ncbi:unnamed protein product, partial [Owenia fusiformis]